MGRASIVSSPLLKTLEIGGELLDKSSASDVFLGISRLMGPSSCSACGCSGSLEDSLLLR